MSLFYAVFPSPKARLCQGILVLARGGACSLQEGDWALLLLPRAQLSLACWHLLAATCKGTDFQPQAVSSCLRSLQVRSKVAVPPGGERAPSLHSRWVGLILLPGLTVWFLFCTTAQVPPRNKGSPGFNAGCVLQAPLLEAGPELYYVALPADISGRTSQAG